MMNVSVKSLPSEDTVLGASYADKRVTFRLWAPTSLRATVNLYKNADSASPDYAIPMEKNDSTGVWTASFAEVDPDGLFYDYTLTNEKGVVTVLDPYAKSMAAYHKDGSVGRGAVVDLAGEKSLPAGGMASSFYPLEKYEDAVIYEVSVRDFTISADSGVAAPKGTYRAFIEKIPYLKELGVTHVQLLPVLNFYNNDETNRAYDRSGSVNGKNYNWGYDPHNYFTPEGWYATDANDPYTRIRELRELVESCHKAGLGVILDVVFNHMATAKFLDDIVPGYYFRMDENGGFKNNSACGNDTATEHEMMARIVRDSTEFFTKEYKIDGFRFDLMGLIEAHCVEKAYEACAKINPHTIFEGEGWRMYNGEPGTVGMDQDYMTRTNHVAVFNDEIRDLLKAGGMNEGGKGLLTGRGVKGSDLFRNVLGNPAHYRVNKPGSNIQYLVCHDGLTLHDAIAHNAGLNPKKANDKREIVRRIRLGNVFALTSQGIAFLHAGQERGRTKPNVKHSNRENVGEFIKNSYNASDNINQIVWKLDSVYQSLLDYTKGLIALRKQTTVFRMADAKRLYENSVLLSEEGESFVFAYRIHNDDGEWIVAVNAGDKKAEVNADVELANAGVLVDAVSAGTKPIPSPSGVKLSARTISLDALTAAVIHIE